MPAGAFVAGIRLRALPANRLASLAVHLRTIPAADGFSEGQGLVLPLAHTPPLPLAGSRVAALRIAVVLLTERLSDLQGMLPGKGCGDGFAEGAAIWRIDRRNRTRDPYSRSRQDPPPRGMTNVSVESSQLPSRQATMMPKASATAVAVARRRSASTAVELHCRPPLMSTRLALLSFDVAALVQESLVSTRLRLTRAAVTGLPPPPVKPRPMRLPNLTILAARQHSR